MRYFSIILFSFSIITGILSAEPLNAQASRPPSILNSFFKQHLQTSSLQFSLFSYKPELGDLTNFSTKCWNTQSACCNDADSFNCFTAHA